MTPTTRARTCGCTVENLAEEAHTIDNLRQSATETVLASRRQALASVSQFKSFAARDPPTSSTPRRDAACCESEHRHSVPGDLFPEDDYPDDEGPRDDPGDDDDDDEDDEDFLDALGELEPSVAVLNNLTLAVNRLSCSARRSNESSSLRAKVRDPDTFDGTEPKKLQTFLVQCELVFTDRPKAFRQDRAKVTFVQSYLKGMALEWFEPDLLDSANPNDRPRWMDSWVAFVAELHSTFGPHNPVADAEHQLDHLQMKDSHHVTRYIVNFNHLASQVRGYGDGTLWHYFYNGLPDQIKDELSCIGKPWLLDELHALTQEIDACYWKCKDEIQQAGKSQTTTTTKPSSSGGTSSSRNRNEKSKSGNPATSPPSKTSFSGSSKLDLNDKLGKDGKLTAAERKHCLDNNLCMFCRGTGHFTDKCSKKSTNAKARTVVIEKSTESRRSDSNSDASPKSKKE